MGHDVLPDEKRKKINKTHQGAQEHGAQRGRGYGFGIFLSAGLLDGIGPPVVHGEFDVKDRSELVEVNAHPAVNTGR